MRDEEHVIIEPKPINQQAWEQLREHITSGQFRPGGATDAVRRLAADVGIPATLSTVGVTENYVEAITDDATKSGNIAINPHRATRDEVLGVILRPQVGTRAIA